MEIYLPAGQGMSNLQVTFKTNNNWYFSIIAIIKLFFDPQWNEKYLNRIHSPSLYT